MNSKTIKTLTSKSSSPTKGVGLDRQKSGGHLFGRYVKKNMKLLLTTLVLISACMLNQAGAEEISLGNFTLRNLPSDWVQYEKSENHIFWHLNHDLAHNIVISLLTNNHFEYKTFGYATMFNPDILKDKNRNIKSGEYRSEEYNNLRCIHFKEKSDNIKVNNVYKEGYICQHPNNIDSISFSYTFFKRNSSTEIDEALFSKALEVINLLNLEAVN